MLIEVTQGDIKNGRRGDPAACPIALAMIRRLPFRRNVGVEIGAVLIYDERWAEVGEYLTSARANRFMRDFDSGHEVRPTRFRLVPA